MRFETLGDKTELVLSPLEALEKPASLIALRDEIKARMPRVDLPEILLEIAARTGCMEAFTHLTERTARAAKERPDQYAHFMEIGESPEFSGHIIYALYNDPKVMEISGQTLIGAEAGEKYGIKDGGKQPPSYRNMLGEPRIPHPAIVI